MSVMSRAGHVRALRGLLIGKKPEISLSNAGGWQLKEKGKTLKPLHLWGLLDIDGQGVVVFGLEPSGAEDWTINELDVTRCYHYVVIAAGSREGSFVARRMEVKGGKFKLTSEAPRTYSAME